MKKEQFLNELRNKLQGLPKEDIDNRISFYEEMINDRVDEGKSEEEAIEDIGSVDEIVNEIAKETPLVKLVKERYKPSRALRVWEIILITLGFPLWFPLLLTAFILAFVGYLLVWVWVIVTYAIELSLVGSTIMAVIVMFLGLAQGAFNPMWLGIALMSAGASILMVFACIGVTKVTFKLSSKIILGIKSAFIKKGRNA